MTIAVKIDKPFLEHTINGHPYSEELFLKELEEITSEDSVKKGHNVFSVSGPERVLTILVLMETFGYDYKVTFFAGFPSLKVYSIKATKRVAL